MKATLIGIAIAVAFVVVVFVLAIILDAMFDPGECPRCGEHLYSSGSLDDIQGNMMHVYCSNKECDYEVHA